MIQLFFSFAIGFALLQPFFSRPPSLGAVLAVGFSVIILIGVPSALFDIGRGSLESVVGIPAILFSAFVFCRSPRKFSLKGVPRRWLPRSRTLSALVLALAAIALLILFRQAGQLTLNYDVLSYHIPEAVAFNDGGRALLLSPSTFYERLPLGAPILEAPFVIGFTPHVFFGVGLQILMVIAVLAGASSAARVTGWLGGRRYARALAFVVYTTHPLFIASVANAVFDPLLALMAVASLELVLATFARSGHRCTALFAGMLTGTAFALKYNAVGVVVAPICLIVGLYTLHRQSRRGWILATCFGVGLALTMAPWLIRAQVVGGNPLHPFRGFDASWTAEQATFVVERHQPQTPFAAQYWKDFSQKADAFGFPGTYGLFLAALLLALLGWRDPRLRTAATIAVAAVIGYAFWLTVRLNPARFLSPSVALAIPPCAMLVGLFAKGILPRALVLGYVAVYAAIPLIQALRLDPVYTTSARQEAMDRLGYTYQFTHLLRADPPREKILLLFEARPSLFPGDPVYNTVWDNPPWASDLKESADEGEFAQRLQDRGIGFLFVNEAEFGRFIDFYAKESIPWEGPHITRAGTSIRIPDERALEYLAAYPPFRFAGFDRRDLTVLLEFLRFQRSGTNTVMPIPPDAEIWYSPIRIPPN